MNTLFFKASSCLILMTSFVLASSPANQTYTDDQLLDLVQSDVLKYFWDFADPTTKLALERYLTDQPRAGAGCVTVGGSGFGILTIIASVDRGLISRDAAVGQFQTMLLTVFMVLGPIG